MDFTWAMNSSQADYQIVSFAHICRSTLFLSFQLPMQVRNRVND